MRVLGVQDLGRRLPLAASGEDACNPFIERNFADGGYAGQKMALAVVWRTGAWKSQIAKRI